MDRKMCSLWHYFPRFLLLSSIVVVIVMAVSPAYTSTTSVEQACQKLKSTLNVDRVVVFSPGSDQYEAAATGAWNAANQQLRPTCIVFAANAAHVRVAMKIIFDTRVSYAVQAGGHSGMKGWNNVNDGILISFSSMKAVFYDSERDTITFEPGITWADAVAGLESEGVAAVGARFSDVGPGFLLGGGLSFLSFSQGYGADNYVELDVVLVNGTSVTATADNEYGDLFKALKGGANRFGIITRYEVRAIHIGKEEDKTWYGGLVTYPKSSHEELLAATAHFARNSKDPNAVLLNSFDHVGDLVIGNAYMFYNGSATLFNQTFSEFLSIASNTTDLGSLSYVDVSNVLDASGDESGHLQLMTSTALEGKAADESIESYLETYRLWDDFSTTFSDELTFGVLAISPITEPQIQIGRERGGNAINPPMRGFVNMMFQIALPLGVNEVPMDMQAARMDYLQRAPMDPGLPLNINECDASQNVFATYGEFDFLKATYAKYDPSGFNLAYTQGPIGL